MIIQIRDMSGGIINPSLVLSGPALECYVLYRTCQLQRALWDHWKGMVTSPRLRPGFAFPATPKCTTPPILNKVSKSCVVTAAFICIKSNQKPKKKKINTPTRPRKNKGYNK